MARDMFHIGTHESNWSDRYGICMLTGEADALGERILCDVNDDGRELLKAVFGMPGLSLSACMNSTVNGKPSTGSLLIPFGLMECIKVVALMRQPGVVEVWKFAGGELRGMTEAECNNPEYQPYLQDRHTRGLSEEDYQKWYELQQRRACHAKMTDTEKLELFALEQRRDSFFGVVKVWQKAPRNRRGPAADSSGLTHQKMM